MLDALRYFWRPDWIIAIQGIFGPEWRLVFEGLSLLGAQQLVILAICWARWFGGREFTCRLMLATFVGLGVSMLIGAVYHVPRPDDPRIRVATDIPVSSFPSRHLVTCMTLWGTFAVARYLPYAVVGGVAVLIGLGRLGLGQHYPGDVLGGIVIGLLVLALIAWIWPHLCAAVSKLSFAQRTMVGGVVTALALVSVFFIPEDRWSLPGLVIGAMLGLPLEAGAVRYEPTPLPLWPRVFKAAVGLAGVGVYIGSAALLDQWGILSDLILPALLAFWILLGAPLVFRWLGWSEREEERGEELPMVVGVAGR